MNILIFYIVPADELQYRRDYLVRYIARVLLVPSSIRCHIQRKKSFWVFFLPHKKVWKKNLCIDRLREHNKIMCEQEVCKSCGKPTWGGCDGSHAESALAAVPVKDRCPHWKSGSSEPCSGCVGDGCTVCGSLGKSCANCSGPGCAGCSGSSKPCENCGGSGCNACSGPTNLK